MSSLRELSVLEVGVVGKDVLTHRLIRSCNGTRDKEPSDHVSVPFMMETWSLVRGKGPEMKPTKHN